MSRVYPQAEIDRIAKELPAIYLETYGNDTETARRLGMSRQALTGLVGRSAPVEAALKAAKDEQCDKVASRLIDIACNPEKKENRGINCTSMIYYLKSRPIEWSDRQTVVIEERTGYHQAAGDQPAEDHQQAAGESNLTVVNGGTPPEGTGTRG